MTMPVSERTEIARRLAEEPYRFGFFQAVRLLERLSPGARPVGTFANPATEVVRFSAHNSIAFPASEIQELHFEEGRVPRMLVNFMGLTGPLGVLPLYYTLLVAERVRERDTALRDFLDIFSHRMISLFYQAWEKYRFTVQYERGEGDRLSHYLLDLIGLGTKGLAGRQAVPDQSLVYYAGLLGQHPRTAVGLRQVLEDYFEAPVEVEQFAGAWYPLSREIQSCLFESNRDCEQLAIGAVVGDEVWDEQSRVRVRLGPLTIEQYLDFLPTGTAYAPLRGLVEFYCGREYDFEVQLVLRREEVPGCELGREDEQAPLLGWMSWAKTVEMRRDPGDAVLNL
jgi:type VI secretion system protein ImpH